MENRIIFQMIAKLQFFLKVGPHYKYILAVVSGLYPIEVLFLMFFVPTSKIGVLQNMFMIKLEYYKK
jgi:hypothetical protein